MNRTNIQWTATPRPDGTMEPGFTSNPVRYRNAEGAQVWACVKVSDGCTNCYAEELALSTRMASEGRAVGAKFNAAEMAKLTPYVDEAELRAILVSRKASGKRVFIGDMTDIFGEWVTDEMLDRVFAAMALRPDITFQVLTKRPERMRAYLNRVSQEGLPDVRNMEMRLALPDWPLPNVWLGTSVENQEQADRRIPELLATPAAVRYLSCEPLLGEVTPTLINPLVVEAKRHISPFRTLREVAALMGVAREALIAAEKSHIDWVIAGGESGNRARPTDVAHIRSLVRQCQAAGVAVFVKQLGSKPYSLADGIGFKGMVVESGAMAIALPLPRLRDRHGGNPEEWPEDLRVREFPGEGARTEARVPSEVAR